MNSIPVQKKSFNIFAKNTNDNTSFVSTPKQPSTNPPLTHYIYRNINNNNNNNNPYNVNNSNLVRPM